MLDVTQILSEIEQGDPQASEKLLPLVYDELRKLAAAKLAQERPGSSTTETMQESVASIGSTGQLKPAGVSVVSWASNGLPSPIEPRP